MQRRTGPSAQIVGWSDELLVGRDELIDELLGVADAAAHGHGSIVVLTGEAGIGKTSVARLLAQRARGQLVVSWGMCLADQSAPPFWPWRPLVELRPPDSPNVAEQAVGAPRLERLTALREELRTRALQQPHLHIIEDLQWADVASVLLVAHLDAVIRDTPLLVVATLRTGEPSRQQLDDAIEAVRRTSRVHDLRPLDDGEIAALIRGTGSEPDEGFVALIQARTDGNPLLVTELLRSVPSTQADARRMNLLAESVPARVSDLTLNRLARLANPVADALAVAAVIGAEGSIATLAEALGADTAGLLELLDQARAAHFLDAAPAGRWQFRHQLIRDAVYSSISGVDRVRHHARVAETLAANPSTPPTTLARHALAAQPLFDADRAVALAARAGESTMAQHAYEEAIGWFTAALEAAPSATSSRWRAELMVLSGEAHRHIGNTAAARRSFIEAADLTDDPALVARAALGYADPGADLGIAYRTDDAVTALLLDRAIGALPPGDSLLVVQLEARLAAELYFSDQPSRARQLADVALARANRLGDARALGVATAVVHDAFVVGQAALDDQLAGSARMLEWARATGSVSALLTAHRARVLDLLAAGEVASMDTEVVAFRRLAEPLRIPGYMWWPALWSAMRALLEGRHELAEERAVSACQMGEGPFPMLAFLNLSFLLFFLRREQGRLAEMEQATRDFTASHSDVPALRVSLTFMLAELGKIDEARGSLDAFDESALAQLRDRNWPASWFQLARAASIVGDRDLATTLLDSRHRPTERCVQVSLATVCLGSTDLATAWLFHTLGDLDAADEHYRSAELLNARIGARSWLAQARADHARLLLERGRPGDDEAAARLLELAQSAALDIGLASLVTVRSESPTTRDGATFRRAGTVWQLSFGGRTAQLADARGLRDIAYLLSRQNEAVSVLELDHDAAASRGGARGAPALDERARREIRDRLQQLDLDEADAESAGDGERAALARERRHELAEAVARDIGLGGRTRLLDDPLERARKTVSTRIRRAITGIGRVHPELARHLQRSIDTGAWCAYRPAEPVDWQT